LWAKLGNWARATAVLYVGLQLCPDDAALKQALAELAAQQGPQVAELAAVLAGDVSVKPKN
jgi:hypothetical protein